MDLFNSRSPKLELIPSEHLEFIIDKSKTHANSTFTIKNISDFSTAFKLKTSSPKDFQISPQEGLIPAAQYCTITISYKISMESLEKYHKFLLQTVAVADNEVDADWKSTGVHEYKLFAKFVDIQYLPRPKAENSVKKEQEEQKVDKEVEKVEKAKRDCGKRFFLRGWYKVTNRSFNFLHMVTAFCIGTAVSYLVITY